MAAGEYGSEYGDEGHAGGAGALMESIREEDYSPGSARSQRHAEASRFGPGPLESVPEPIPEQSVSPPGQRDYSSRTAPGPGPVRPLAAQGQAGKAAKYDEDGFLLDDEEEEEPQPPAPPTRPSPTPAKPPSEYDLAYDSSPAPSPRANQLSRNQDAAPSNVGQASRQIQPPQQSTAESGQRDLASQISRLAEEESDEDDFLAAAVAAVEAQDKGQPMPSTAQRAQQGRAAAPTAPANQRQQQPLQQRPTASEAFLPSDDDMSPQAVQTQQQSRPSMPTIPPSVPRTWQRPSPQPHRSSQDSEDTPQRSEQSLRSRYGPQRPGAGADTSGGAAAAFLAARTGSGTAPALPQGQPPALSSRPLLSGAAQPPSPGPAPIARAPTSAYNPPQPAAAATAAAAEAPKPSSKWFRKTPPVAPPPQAQPPLQTQPPPQPRAPDAPYNPFDSPTSQNGDARMSPMAITNQQQPQQQQQKPQQEAGMFMDESDEEEDQAYGRPGSQRGSGPGQGFAQQQPQMNKVSPTGAISAGVGGEHFCPFRQNLFRQSSAFMRSF